MCRDIHMHIRVHEHVEVQVHIHDHDHCHGHLLDLHDHQCLGPVYTTAGLR